MYILSSVKVRRDLREYLVQTYPLSTFNFCSDMEEAEPFLDKAEILLTYGEDLDNGKIEKANQLKWINVLSAGIDQMPAQKIKEKGILVTNSRGIHKIPMAEYALSMLLQSSRNMKTLIRHEQENNWDRSVKMTEITGKTMLIAGTGAIGQEVARLAKAFRMKTVGVSRSGRIKDYFDEVKASEELEKVIGEADFIVSVLPSTEETKEYYQPTHFKQMKSTAIFLNMGRGDAVKESVIINAIKESEISHAVLDVFEQEPLPDHSPLWNMEGVTVTPHLSGISPEYQPRAIDIFEKNLAVYTRGGGNYINQVDPTRGY